MEFVPEVRTRRSLWQDVRDGVVIVAGSALVSYLLHEAVAPSSQTRAFLDNQRRMREVSEQLLAVVQQIDARVQQLAQKSDAMAQALNSLPAGNEADTTTSQATVTATPSSRRRATASASARKSRAAKTTAGHEKPQNQES